jgi:hypothetical protein
MKTENEARNRAREGQVDIGRLGLYTLNPPAYLHKCAFPGLPLKRSGAD